MVDFRMPSLGADMEAGTLVEWLVKPGDEVKHGDVIAVVETQKGAIEIEVFQNGQIEKILVDVNSKVPVGTPLARIRTATNSEPVGLILSPATTLEPKPVPVVPPVSITAAPLPVASLTTGRERASPAARRFAESHHIELTAITGSGPNGEIVLADVEHSLGAASTDKKRFIGLDLDAMRVAIATAMARSKREIPHYYLEHNVDLTASEQWLSARNAMLPPDARLLMSALTIKSVALAARRFPSFNGFYQNGRFQPAPVVHIGVAIAIRGGGLAAPALHDADQLTLDQLMTRLRDLVQRTRAGRIRSSELSDSTITISSLGDRGVDVLYGVVYPPQVAIVGFGKAALRPWVVDGAIGPRSIMTLTLSADHRVSDGHAGALFLAEICRLLQEPEKL